MKPEVDINGRGILAIDLGTAALLSSQPIISLSNYPPRQVGALGFAPLEALAGLAHIRETGRYQDIYSLGCLLFDLFNMQMYYQHLSRSPGFANCLGACVNAVDLARATGKDENTVFEKFKKTISQTKSQVTLPDLNQIGSNIPKSIMSLVSQLIKKMTAIDYRDRLIDQNFILRRIDTTKGILRHELAQKRRRSVVQARRLKRFSSNTRKI